MLAAGGGCGARAAARAVGYLAFAPRTNRGGRPRGRPALAVATFES